MFDIEKVLNSLSSHRPIFHSEADFQHALAWEIKQHYPNSNLRLETKVHGKDSKIYLDLLVIHNNEKIAIELKYKTKALIQQVNNEEYVLNQQGAHDIGRYDVLKDFQRVEHMIENGVVDKGYVIFLTNDPSYYQPSISDRNTVDKDFRIHFGQKINGVLSWADNTGEGTKKGREKAIRLLGDYEMEWSTYSKVNEFNNGHFLYICIPMAINSDITMSASKNDKSNINSFNEFSTKIDWFNSFKEKQEIPQSQRDLRDRLANHLRSLGYQVKIDYPIQNHKVDIWADKNGRKLLIEMRFRTSLLKTIYNGNHIHLKKQGALDVSRYDFIKDVKKLEDILNNKTDYTGYALLITNEHLYWKPSSKADAVDKDFHIHQDRILTGNCAWDEKASKGTTNRREEPVHLVNQYHLKWQDYLTLGSRKNEQFKALLIESK